MSLTDEFEKQFPPMSGALRLMLGELDGLPARVTMLGEATAGALERLAARVDGVTSTLNTVVIPAIADLTARVSKLEGGDPEPEPDLDTVHVGAFIKNAETLLGWTTVQETDLSAATAAIVQKCAHSKGQHAIAFGGVGPMQTVAGGPIDFSYLDKIFGYPNRTDGYFGANCVRVLTAYACPPYMRVPKAGTAPNPTGTPTMGVYDQVPPHWSHHDDYGKFIAAIVDRYQIDIVQEWNEGKGEWIGASMPAGAVLVPPGSGLPQAPGGATNRWAMELHTDRFNKVCKWVKAIRPECEVTGPYMVTRSYEDPNNADSANDVFPKDLRGPWGNADWEIMRHVMYHLEHADVIDAICLDTKTSVNDGDDPGGISAENQWSGLQKILDWQDWLDRLADFDPVKYGRAKNVKLRFAEAYTRLPEGLNSTNHQKACATDAWGYINYVLRSRTVGWMRWQTEGNRGASDSASAHSISLVHAKGSAKSLQPTEAVPVYAGLVEHFKPGTQLYSVDTGDGSVTGIASDTTLCLVSKSEIQHGFVFKGVPLVLAPYDVKFVAR